MRRLPAIGLGVVLAAGFGPPRAHAQIDSREAIALQDEILELRNEVQSLLAQRGSSPPIRYSQPQASGGSDLAPQLLDRVSRLEDEVRSLRGQLEEVQNAQRQMAADFAKQLGDLQFRLQNGGAAPAPSAAPDTGPPSSAPALGRTPRPLNSDVTPPPRTPQIALQQGEAALARRDYTAAAADAHEVLSANRAGPSAGAAQMLLGQALTGKRDYQGAAVAYSDAAQRLHGSPRGQEALLGLASSLTAINEKAAACGALDQLRTASPPPRPDMRAAAATARSRAGCR